MRQLLEALRFLHAELGLMHRNVKRANCLWADGQLTLIDFECAVSPSPGAVFSRVGNNRYRAPEVAAAKRQATRDGGSLLYRPGCPGWLTPAAPYSFPSDIFSAGVCFAELLLRRRRLFADVDFLEEDYERLRRRLRKWEEREGHLGRGDARRIFEPYLGDDLAAELLTPAAADLLARMLCFDPLRRVDAQEALRHEYFRQRFSDAGSRGDEESATAAASS